MKVAVIVGWATVFAVAAVRLLRYFLFEHADLIDTHRTRIPLLVATVAVVLYCVAGVVFGGAVLIHAVVTGTSTALWIVGGAAVLPAGISVWGYVFSVALWRRQLKWSPCGCIRWRRRIEQMAKQTALPESPRVVLSERVALPLVVGRRSHEAFLVIPVAWTESQPPSDSGQDVREFQLHHELAHCRNRDVGFMTWAHVFVRWLVPLAAAMAVATSGGAVIGVLRWRVAWMVSAASLLALGMIWVLYHVVMRHREFDADARAALILAWPVRQLAMALDACEAAGLASGSRTESRAATTPWSWRLEMWLADKAAFGRVRVLWRGIEYLWHALGRTHPGVAARKERLREGIEETGWRSPSLGLGVWTGITAGMFMQAFLLASVTVGLVGSASAAWVENVLMPFWGMGSVCLLALGLAFIALLPVRFSAETGPASFRYVAKLLGWFAVVGLSGLLVLALSGPALREISEHFVVAIGIAYTIVISLSILSGGLRESAAVSWRSWTPTACTLLLLLAAAGGLEVIVPGASFAFVMGFWVPLVMLSNAGDRTSWEEGYGIRRRCSRVRLLEGRAFRRWGILAGWALDMPVYLLPVIGCGVTALTAYVVAHYWLGFAPSRPAVFAVGVPATAAAICLMVLWVARRDWRARCNKVDPLTSKRAAQCAAVLLHWVPQRLSTYLPCLRRYAMDVLKEARELHLPERSGTLLELSWTSLPLLRTLRRDGPEVDNLIKQVHQCAHRDGGFGPWPGASPRLSSTFRALGVLDWADRIGDLDRRKHLAWVEGLRQPDGGFCDPLLRYPPWQMAYWALRCCRWLGGDYRAWARACLSAAAADKPIPSGKSRA
ncbi:MAG: prenyltransferase/squalene oxidase repeat-containing protein, partial [bacterium]